ncbi:MAG: methyltransferase domain-containing protein [Comamonadaceae bacterium]|nr:MAG: methyltransferase domain-containing protein [Comamonadaceae bacterium]
MPTAPGSPAPTSATRPAPASGASSTPAPAYTAGPASSDGIGKRYMGREISQVMGWQGASWLEREEREREERTDLLLRVLDLKPGTVVADVGAGTGYLSRRMARAVAPSGRVVAVDVQPQMIELLRTGARREGIANIEAVLGSETDASLPPSSIDLAIMVDVYHELAFPHEMLQSIVRGLKPGGRLVFVEYRAEDRTVPIKTLHKMSEAQVRREAEVHALTWERTDASLPWQHVVVFRKQGAR